MLEAMQPRPGGLYLDGTLGAGGYAHALLQGSHPDGMVVGLDLDAEAIARTSKRMEPFGERFVPIQGGFHEAKAILRSRGITAIDGAVLDLGLSSDQLDDAQRGFSFQASGPLDMRFDRDSGESLVQMLKRVSIRELEMILSAFGEERHYRKIARSIRAAIDAHRLETTGDLAVVIAKAVGGRRGKIHPATRAFQAFRIAVNQELENLDRALADIPDLLKPGGRFCVVSYHSLEDRRVKLAFRERKRLAEQWALVTVKPIRPDAEEVRANPRGRSARLRVLEAVSHAL